MAHTQSTEEAQDKYFVTMRNIYEGRYGCECKHLKSKDLLDSNKVSELMEWADIIYEGGGNTLDMIALWKETESYKGMISRDLYKENYKKILKNIDNIKN